MALVCQIDAALEALDRGQLLRMDQSAVVQHDGIQRKARLKAAYLSEERTAAARGQIERLRDPFWRPANALRRKSSTILSMRRKKAAP